MRVGSRALMRVCSPSGISLTTTGGPWTRRGTKGQLISIRSSPRALFLAFPSMLVRVIIDHWIIPSKSSSTEKWLFELHFLSWQSQTIGHGYSRDLRREQRTQGSSSGCGNPVPSCLAVVTLRQRYINRKYICNTQDRISPWVDLKDEFFCFQCFGNTVCKKNCASDDLDCYILDNNGFVIISEKHEHTGKFFGDIDGTIMDSLVQDRIFKRVNVVDYQGICSPQSSHISAAPTSSSYSILKTVAAVGNFMWTWTVNLNLVDALQPVWAYASDSDNDGKV